MDVKLTWNQDMAFTGTADSGHEVTLDSSEGSGGHNTGFRPMELMALGTAGCSSMDVVSILRQEKGAFHGL
jgi:putative redox protein